MHWLLNQILKNVADFQFPASYTPEILKPRYTLEKLSDNLAYNCNLHNEDLKLCVQAYSEYIVSDKNVAYRWSVLTGYKKDDIIRLALVYQLRKLQSFFPQDPFAGTKVFFLCLNVVYRAEKDIIQNHWIKPYYDWFDSLFKVGVLKETKNIFCTIPKHLINAVRNISQECAINNVDKILSAFAPELKSSNNIQEIISGIDELLEQFEQYNAVRLDFFGALMNHDEVQKNWQEDLNNSMVFWLKHIPNVDSVKILGNYLYCYPQPKEFKTVEIQKLADRVISITWSNIDKKVKEYVDSPDILPLEKKMFFDLLKDLPGYDKSNSAQIIHDFYIEYKLSHSNNFMQRWETTEKLIVFQQQQRQQELEAVAEDTRKKVLFEMSHTIKNLMASVSEPLDMLKDQLEGTQRRTVENALAGAGLIRDLAVGVHMSMRGEPGTWRKDVLEPGFGAATLDKIILDAVRHAVSNMFDGKYFAQFVKNYFGKDLNTFMQAQNEWKATVSAEDTFACINKYFFDFKIDCGESSLNIPIGDRDGTATKLLILFQELFLNAVKYSSFTEREKRFVKLDVAITPENWNIKLSNSAVGRKNTKSSGIGLAVIKNFADLFEAKYDANCKNDTYISSINFSLNK